GSCRFHAARFGRGNRDRGGGVVPAGSTWPGDVVRGRGGVCPLGGVRDADGDGVRQQSLRDRGSAECGPGRQRGTGVDHVVDRARPTTRCCVHLRHPGCVEQPGRSGPTTRLTTTRLVTTRLTPWACRVCVANTSAEPANTGQLG